MKVRVYAVLLGLFIIAAGGVVAQDDFTSSGAINRSDENGLRQGPWEKTYPDGTLMYRANFLDGKPVGEMLRYHPGGKLMAWVVYDAEGVNGKGELFDENGLKVAEGCYIGSDKTGEWRFYNSKGDLLTKENYKNNLKDGESRSYYQSGRPASLRMWRAGVLHGAEIIWYPSGSKRLTASYEDGELHGAYTVYYENGHQEVFGRYNKGKMDGPWFFLDFFGKEEYRLNYKNGVADEQELLERREDERFREFEKNRGKIKDPEDYRNDPDSYMMGL